LILALPLGAEMAVFQGIILHRWIKRPFLWFISFSFVLTCLLSIYDVIQFGILILISSGPFKVQIINSGELEPGFLPFILFSVPFGILIGVVIGTVQSFWLRGGNKRYYVLFNAITCAALLPLFIYFSVVPALILSGFP
jgi:hypothetical protein